MAYLSVMSGIIVTFAGVYGVLIGSFLNALVWRFRETHDDDGVRLPLKAKRAHDLSIIKGRSMCPSCTHQLHAVDLVPVVSWLVLRGSCRYCKAPISAQYPMVEILTGILFALSAYYWPHGSTTLGYVALVGWLVIIAGFVAMSVYDLKWFLLPDKFVLGLLPIVIVVVASLALQADDTVHAFIQAAIGALTISGIFGALFYMSGGAWIGGGDVKLGVLIGLLAGDAVRAILLIFIASVLGLVLSVPLLVTTKKEKMKLKIPFGPMLLAACVIVFLWGSVMVDWYSGLLII